MKGMQKICQEEAGKGGGGVTLRALPQLLPKMRTGVPREQEDESPLGKSSKVDKQTD